MTSKVQRFSWEGAKGELLASWILSQYCLVTRVPREADVGIDLLCTLARKDANALHAGKTFGVQVKATCNDPPKPWALGGLRKGKCQLDEVRWFYQQDIPIFLASVDQRRGQLRLYTTIPAWNARLLYGWVHQLRLVPELPVAREPRFTPVKQHSHVPGGHTCNPIRCEVGIGSPVFEGSAVEELSEQERSDRWHALDFWTSHTQDCIRYDRCGFPTCWNPIWWETNGGQARLALGTYSNPTPEIMKSNMEGIVNGLVPGVSALAMHWLGVKDPAARSLIPMLNQLKTDFSLPDLLVNLGDRIEAAGIRTSDS